MANQALRVQEFISGFGSKIDVHLLDISSGIIIKRIVQESKVKFKAYDTTLLLKDYLDIKNLVKKRCPSLLLVTSIEESLYLLVSPFYADIVRDYREDLYLISTEDSIIKPSDLKVKTATFEQGLNNISNDRNYFVLITEDNKIIDKKVFYCDTHKEYLDALYNATFSRFLSIIQSEKIKDENTLISCLAKEGVPFKIQEKYMDFWYEYNEFLDIVDALCYEIEKQRIDYIEGLEGVSSKRLRPALIKLLKYDTNRANDLLNEIIEGD